MQPMLERTAFRWAWTAVLSWRKQHALSLAARHVRASSNETAAGQSELCGGSDCCGCCDCSSRQAGL